MSLFDIRNFQGPKFFIAIGSSIGIKESEIKKRAEETKLNQQF